MEPISSKESLVSRAGEQEGWRINDLIFQGPDNGVCYVIAQIIGDSNAAALAGARAILHAVEGRTTFIRIRPEAASQKDYLEDKIVHRGYVRFSFKNEPGNWIFPALAIENTVETTYLGLAQLEARG
jgi:hypothetical protein